MPQDLPKQSWSDPRKGTQQLNASQEFKCIQEESRKREQSQPQAAAPTTAELGYGTTEAEFRAARPSQRSRRKCKCVKPKVKSICSLTGPRTNFARHV